MECPECGLKEVGDRWCSGRRLQPYCRACLWCGPEREPEQREVKTTKRIPVSRFNGWVYEVFDRYGHPMIYSRTYGTEEEAVKALERELARGKTDEVAGPYSGVLWPAYVEVQGRFFS